MREIKFRGLAIDGSGWKYGFLIGENLIGDLEEAQYNAGSIGCGVEDRGCIDRYDGAAYGYEQAEQDILQNVFTVDQETVGQYTGLKDKNGVEIWEGDVVYVTRTMGSPFESMLMEWSRNHTGWRLTMGSYVYHIPTRQQMLVIGTMHDKEATK